MVKQLLSRKVSLLWLVAAAALAPALAIIFKLWVLDAPPSGVLILPAIVTPTTIAVSLAKPESTASTRIATSIRSSPSPVPLTKEPATITPQGSLPEPTLLATPSPSPPATPTMAGLIAYISGEVVHEGVYHLPVDSRVADLVAAAGGLKPDANGDLINLAERVQDEEHVIVPAKGTTPVVALVQTPVRSPTRVVATATPAINPEVPSATSRPRTTPTKASTAPPAKVNINTASQDELETLPGIGPSLAARIIAYRQANGPFATPEDLMQVPGIKQGIFSKLKDAITVGP